MKVGITGSTGFVGHNLVNYLSKIKTFKLTRAAVLIGEIYDADIVIHLAGKAHDVTKTANPNEYYEVNFELTKKLYDAFLLSDAKKFIFISSVKAVADVVNGILTEESTPIPQTHYGKSKFLAEDYIRNQPLPEGKSVYILRPCMIHGPGNKGNLNLLYQFVARGIPYPLGAFENKRSFLSVENLCFVINQLILNDVTPGTYNVADDEPLSTNQVVKILGNAIQKKGRLWPLPIFLLKGIARAGDLLKLPLNSERLTKLTENYVVSNKKLKEALKTELPLSSVQGLSITAQSFAAKK